MRETIPAALAGERLDRVVAMLTGMTRAEVADLVDSGGVRLNARPARVRSRRVAEGDVVDVVVPASGGHAGLVPDPSVVVPVVYEDAHVVVVDKPAGLVVHPGAGHPMGTLVHGLLARFPDLASLADTAADDGEDDSRPGIVHRLDAGTSGLMVVARTADARTALVGQLSSRSVERRYLALVRGGIEEASGVVDAPIGRSQRSPTRMSVSARGRLARTRYSVIASFRQPFAASYVECTLETGRTHQIRAHFEAIGHPVAGDPEYGGAGALGLRRQFLHAVRLAFDHPLTGERVDVESPLPPDLAAALPPERDRGGPR